MKVTKLALTVAVVLFAATCRAEETDPGAIFKKVAAAYNAVKTYSDEGTLGFELEGSTSISDSNTLPLPYKAKFTTKLKKPDLYLIYWTGKIHRFEQMGAVWDDGSQTTFYMVLKRSYWLFDSPEKALIAAGDVSGGVTTAVPSLFFQGKGLPLPFGRLTEPKLEGSEKVGDDDCYVISGASNLSKLEKFYISKSTFFIRKYERELEPTGGPGKYRAITDKQVEAMVKGRGKEPTPENLKDMRAELQHSQNSSKAGKMQGTLVETYNKITSPNLTSEDFTFPITEAAELKETPFGKEGAGEGATSEGGGGKSGGSEGKGEK